MAVYPGAVYRPLNQFSNQGTKPRLGVVLHVNDSNGASLYNWIAGNNNMSCHWQVAKTGAVEQYVDTDNGSWCQMAGNDTYLSIETEGYPTEALTDAQVQAIAGILAWAYRTHGIPLVISDTVGAPGFAWHGMGGTAWGGHTGCPGDLRKAQRAQILTLAQQAINPAPASKDVDVFLAQYPKSARPDAVYLVIGAGGPEGPGGVQVWVTDPTVLADRQARLKAAGLNSAVQSVLHSRAYYGPLVGPDPEVPAA